MKKQWIVEAAYILAAVAFLGICIESKKEKEPGREVFGTEELLPSPEAAATPGPLPKPTQGSLQETGNIAEPIQDLSQNQESTSEPVRDVPQGPVSEPVPTQEIPDIPGRAEDPDKMQEADNIRNEAYEQYPNEKKAWWFLRNEKHKSSGSGEEFPIAPYSAYYLNKEVGEKDKVIYLTFDCGYENGFTPAILDTLAEKNVKAMFFVTRDFIVRNPAYVKRMKEEGHLVGNHTVRHLSSPSLTPEELEAELREVEKTMEEQTGYRLDPFFRPPMGEYSERTLKATQDMGYASIFWSIAYYDYNVNEQPGKDYVTEHFAKYHHNGAIALLHNISESNTQALPEVIELLRAEGYRFGMLTELTEK